MKQTCVLLVAADDYTITQSSVTRHTCVFVHSCVVELTSVKINYEYRCIRSQVQ